MAQFIKIKSIYNPQTAQGEGCKLINITQIKHVTDWSKSKLKHKKGINSIIQFLNGDTLHVGDTIDEIEEKIIK